MKKIYFLLFCITAVVKAQPTWHLLSSSPLATLRHDDVFFINENMGWVVNVKGQVWKTNDGGNTWNQIATQSTSFRCVAFLDSLNGFIGNLGPGNWAPTTDTVPLYRTTNGGVTWTPVTNIVGPIPKGICGIRAVNDSVLVACGRVAGPSFFMRSTDKGNTWTSKDMNAYAGMLIDVSFISTDTGFVVGGTDTSEWTSKSIILYTTDGGNTWTPKSIGSRPRAHCWKIEKTQMNKKTYYVSVERGNGNDSLIFIKSTDGGNTWIENIKVIYYPSSQGIGFLNDSVGWIGGGFSSWNTLDAGQTFTSMSLFNALNRMRFVNDSVGYAVGKRIYKFSTVPASGITQYPNFKGYSFEQNFPNPFTTSTSIKYTIPKSEHVVIEVFDIEGRWIKTLVNEKKNAGTYKVEFKLTGSANARFICAITAGDYGNLIRMISVE